MNSRYESLVFGVVPAGCHRALDVGCGNGGLTRELRRRGILEIVGLDQDEPCIQRCRDHPEAGDIRYVAGDLRTADLAPGGFQLVSSVASLHHVDARDGLVRLRSLVAPGGVLIVVGLARPDLPKDLPIEILAQIVARPPVGRLGCVSGIRHHEAPLSRRAFMNGSVLLTIIGPVIGAVGVTLAILNRRTVTRQQQVSRYRELREVLKTQQGRLSALAWEAADPTWRSYPAPVLTKPGWILETPLALEKVGIRLVQKSRVQDRSKSSDARATRLLPHRESRSSRLRYSDALVEIDGLSHLYNGNVYRPVAIDADGVDLSIDFVNGEYFDHLNTSEVLAYDMAAAERRRLRLRRTYRETLHDPFDLCARATSLGVLTLTIIQAGDGARFLMHARDGNQVVVGSKVMHVIPAGEFTPASVYLEASTEDFDIWRTIMREYAEELLDREEAYGKEGTGLNYLDDSPFRELNEARRAGNLRIYTLGIGLDPLTWKPELFTVCVFESATFENIFQGAVKRTWEGIILRGADGKGLRFDADTVNRYADDPNTRRGATVCLRQAWKHRFVLGIS